MQNLILSAAESNIERIYRNQEATKKYLCLYNFGARQKIEPND